MLWMLNGKRLKSFPTNDGIGDNCYSAKTYDRIILNMLIVPFNKKKCLHLTCSIAEFCVINSYSVCLHSRNLFYSVFLYVSVLYLSI